MASTGFDFYVYVLYREDMTPFYVGKGRGNRWVVHGSCRKNFENKNIILDMRSRGVVMSKAKIAEGLSEWHAYELERAIIAKIGRRPAGPLVNLTDGGDGCRDPSGKIRDRIAASLLGRKNGPQTPETRAKISSALRGVPRGPQTPETREKRAAGLKAAYASGKRSLRGGMNGKRHSEETKERMRLAAKGRRISEIARERMSVSAKARRATPETKETMRQSHLRRWSSKSIEERKAHGRAVSEGRAKRRANVHGC